MSPKNDNLFTKNIFSEPCLNFGIPSSKMFDTPSRQPLKFRYHSPNNCQHHPTYFRHPPQFFAPPPKIFSNHKKFDTRYPHPPKLSAPPKIFGTLHNFVHPFKFLVTPNIFFCSPLKFRCPIPQNCQHH